MRAFAWLAVAFAAYAQAPVRVAFQCTGEDLQSIAQTCSDTEPCPVYLELTELDVVGPKLFITGNLHTDTTTIASILLASADGGATWTEPYGRIRAAGLDQIQFIDFEAGWIGGHFVVGTPKDPFVLMTTDGGKTWREQPLFDETHPGTIEQFWFDSRTSGMLVLDRVQASETGVRYELYESMTGGTSWTLKQASAKAIRLKRPPGLNANASWRLRADGATKTYRIEHQDGGRWVAASTFPVKIGECKAPEPSLAEPPDPAAEGEKPAAAEPVEKREPPKKPPTLKKKKPL